MSKQLIVCDIDDVIAANAEGFIAWCNEQFGTNLSVDDYTEDFKVLWPDADQAEIERRANLFHNSDAVLSYGHIPDGFAVLTALAEKYRIIAATSRRRVGEEYTRTWINQYYKGIFEDIVFAGIFDTDGHERHLRTKSDIYQTLRPNYVIDDQLKHCMAASELGIQTILFGQYSWTKTESLPSNIAWCPNWKAVKECFDGVS